MAAPDARKKSSLPSRNETRKSIPGPTNLKTFLQMILLHFCKKYLLIDTRYRVGIYLVALTAGGVIFDVFHAPASYFSDKNNFFNQYFVKYGWGWTCLTTGFFIYLTCRTYCLHNNDRVIRHLSRLAVSTAVWYIWVNIIFQHVEHTTGVCTSVQHGNKVECVTAGFEWLGYDISGHTFLLIYSTLVISEEANVFRNWERIADAIITEDETLKKLDIHQFSVLKEMFLKSNTYVKVSFIILTVISMIWEVMLISTIIYFHTVPQKFLGGLIAMCSWFATYQFWYKWDNFSPGTPGTEMALFLKKRRR